MANGIPGRVRRLLFLPVFLALIAGSGPSQAKTAKVGKKIENPIVILKTSLGQIELEIFQDKAPVTAANFLRYVEENFYDGTIFHRVIPKFMIQGGGFASGLKQKKTHDPIKNEAANGLSNTRGTIAMARTDVVDSATSQFFVNLVDNLFLNHSKQSFGYCVFGRVRSGMEIVDKIGAVPTHAVGYYQDVPAKDVAILSATRAEK